MYYKYPYNDGFPLHCVLLYYIQIAKDIQDYGFRSEVSGQDVSSLVKSTRVHSAERKRNGSRLARRLGGYVQATGSFQRRKVWKKNAEKRRTKVDWSQEFTRKLLYYLNAQNHHDFKLHRRHRILLFPIFHFHANLQER
jgi:hypothetical protein